MTAKSARRGAGRPTAFKPDFIGQAKKLCALGAIDEEIAEFFGVDVRTIYCWKEAHPEFCQALNESKKGADERVERSLYQTAISGNVNAQIFWLKNRRAEQWRDNQDIEHSANKDAPPVFTPKIDNG